MVLPVEAETFSAAEKQPEQAGEGRTVRFRAISASGFYPKTFTVRGKRRGSQIEQEFGRFVHVGRGGNNWTRFPDEWIVIEDVVEIYLLADITVLYETPYTRPLMRSDDPATSNYLFYKVDDAWVQRPANMKIDVFGEQDCTIQTQSWEDGGGFEMQDFVFEVANMCATVRR